jgi:hypothetical protein
LEPGNGPGSPTTGSPPVAATTGLATLLLASFGCSAHCVRPDWPEIIASAFGVEAEVTVMWKLSNSAKRSAYCQRYGAVSQSTWPNATSPICFCTSVGLEVGASPVVLLTICPCALVVRPSSSSAKRSFSETLLTKSWLTRMPACE